MGISNGFVVYRIECPDCGSEAIVRREVRKGDRVTCPMCQKVSTLGGVIWPVIDRKTKTVTHKPEEVVAI